MAKGQTHYSEKINGARGNYNWPVRFEVTDGYLGIWQYEDGKVKDCVLLSPKQVSELTKFVEQKRR
jgi:hypothetical protein